MPMFYRLGFLLLLIGAVSVLTRSFTFLRGVEGMRVSTRKGMSLCPGECQIWNHPFSADLALSACYSLIYVFPVSNSVRLNFMMGCLRELQLLVASSASLSCPIAFVFAKQKQCVREASRYLKQGIP